MTFAYLAGMFAAAGTAWLRASDRGPVRQPLVGIAVVLAPLLRREDRLHLSKQDKRFSRRKQPDNVSTIGPVQRCLRDALRTVDQLNERFEEAGVNGIGRLDESLADTATEFLHLDGLADQFINGLIKIGIEKVAVDIIGGAVGGPSGGSGKGIGSLIKSVGRFFAGGRASGDNVADGGNQLVGENLPELPSLGHGRVYPNGALPAIGSSSSGSTSRHQTFHSDASGVDRSGFAEGIISSVRQKTISAIRQSRATTLNATLAQVQRLSTLGT